MNSENQRENEKFLSDIPTGQKLKENATIEKGNIIEDLINHQGWKMLIKTLEGDKERLRDELDSCTTVEQMNKIQAEIKVIRRIVDNPKSYLINREAIRRKDDAR